MFSFNFVENFLTAYLTPFSVHGRCDNETLPQHHWSLKYGFSKVVFYYKKLLHSCGECAP